MPNAAPAACGSAGPASSPCNASDALQAAAFTPCLVGACSGTDGARPKEGASPPLTPGPDAAELLPEADTSHAVRQPKCVAGTMPQGLRVLAEGGLNDREGPDGERHEETRDGQRQRLGIVDHGRADSHCGHTDLGKQTAVRSCRRGCYKQST